MRWYDCFSFIHSHAEALCQYGLLFLNVSFLVWLGVIYNYIPVAQQVATLLFPPAGARVLHLHTIPSSVLSVLTQSHRCKNVSPLPPLSSNESNCEFSRRCVNLPSR